MSTRCEVRIVEQLSWKKQPLEIKLYHHHDGYPEGVGQDLINLCEKHYKRVDKMFMFQDASHLANLLIKKADDEYELTQYRHIDIEYLYIIDINKGTITCKSVYYKDWNSDHARPTVRKTIDLSKFFSKDLTEQVK